MKQKLKLSYRRLKFSAHSTNGDTCPSNKDGSNLHPSDRLPLDPSDLLPSDPLPLDPLEDSISTTSELSSNSGIEEVKDLKLEEPTEIEKQKKLNQFFFNIKILDFVKSVFLKEKNLSFLGFVTGILVLFCFFLLVIFRVLFKGS